MPSFSLLSYASFKEVWELIKNSKLEYGRGFHVHDGLRHIYYVDLNRSIKEITYTTDRRFKDIMPIEFETYEEAQAVALTADHADSDSRYYFGQYLIVKKDFKLYMIDTDRSLTEVK